MSGDGMPLAGTGRPGAARPLERPPDGRRWGWRLFATAALLSVIAIGWQAATLALRWALADLEHGAAGALRLYESALRSELSKFRAVPYVLANDPEVRDLLAAPADRARTDRVNRRLEALSEAIGAGLIHVMARDGLTLVASTWNTPDNILGNDYRFRPYFIDAVAHGTSAFFGVGTVTRRAGLFLGHAVREGVPSMPSGPATLGVVSVKVEFGALEAVWRRNTERVAVSGDGVVLITNVDAWRYRALTPPTPEQAARMRAARQFGDEVPAPIAWSAPRTMAERFTVVTAGEESERAGATHLVVAGALPELGWTMRVLTPIAPVWRAVASAVAIAALGWSALLAGAALLAHRRGRVRAQRRHERDSRAELSRLVEGRTADLLEANRRLTAEIDERRRAAQALRSAQDELVQAAKLAAIGQVSATVAHEINQPLAAIRAFADNAAILVERGRAGDARANMAEIATLTERIARLSQSLKGFARRAAPEIGPVRLAAAVDASLQLLDARVRRQGVTVARNLPAEDLWVVGEAIRLQQILVNLLQNALDALAGIKGGRIAVGAVTDRESVRLIVRDYGPGITPERLAHVFDAFYTTKPAGLGLGLSICQSIVQEFGGTIAAANVADGGAAFTVMLRRAGAPAAEAAQ